MSLFKPVNNGGEYLLQTQEGGHAEFVNVNHVDEIQRRCAEAREHKRMKRQDKIEGLLLEFADKLLACAQNSNTVTYRDIPKAAKKLAKELSK